MLRSYLSVVAGIYFALAVWCSLDPETTTRTVGFERIGGSGRSEFLVIYGGLESPGIFASLAVAIPNRTAHVVGLRRDPCLSRCLSHSELRLLYGYLCFDLQVGCRRMGHPTARGR